MALQYLFILLLFPLSECTFYSLRAEDSSGTGQVPLEQYQGMVSLATGHQVWNAGTT